MSREDELWQDNQEEVEIKIKDNYRQNVDQTRSGRWKILSKIWGYVDG